MESNRKNKIKKNGVMKNAIYNRRDKIKSDSYR